VVDHLREGSEGYFDDPLMPPGSPIVARTSNPAMRAVLRKVGAVAPTESTVLLTGETGTGKNVLARIIHYQSRRRDFPLVSVQCSAIVETLLESELFGHEKGAFTGAIRRKLGKFEIAHRGSIFLDEIGTISLSAQVRLLRVLEEREFSRVGGEDTVHVDVRIIAATNSDLKHLIAEGTFRNDLYYRLNVFPVEVPPLRERLEDIPDLVEVFLKRLEKVYRKGIRKVDAGVVEAFQRYAWPGNIRELENVVERAYILGTPPVLWAENFGSEVLGAQGGTMPLEISSEKPLSQVREDAVRVVEAGYLRALLSRHRGRINESAKAAGVGSRQIRKLLRKHGIRKEEFKGVGEV
jgi:transcriptional regulator with GAF, ATPase, and Fis domain